jgi:hypothetical protein
MYPYLDIHYEYLILLLGYGGLLFLLIALTIGWSRLRPGGAQDAERATEHLETFPTNVREGHGRIPLFLIVLYVSVVIWALVYIVAHGGGMAFGG